MKDIVIAVLFSLAIVLGSLYFFRVPIDTNFVDNLLNGILSNLLVSILIIFVIDRLFKKIESKKLFDINKRKSETISLMINIFALKILSHLKLKIENNLEAVTDGRALEYLLKINKEQDWFNILYKQVLATSNKKDYLKNLETVIKDGATSINESLKDVYPHPAPDLVLIVDEIYTLSGNALAMSVMSEFREEVNKNIENTDNKINEDLERVLVKVFINHGAQELFSSICDKLSVISIRANENRLFIE